MREIERIGAELEARFPELRKRGPAVRTVRAAELRYGPGWMDAAPRVVISRVEHAYRSWRPSMQEPRSPWWRRLFG